MTAKEKAKELVDKYKWHEFFNTPLDVDGMLEFMPESIAKQCALIAVDDILSIIKHTFYSKYYKYWESVKQEIEKL